MGRSMYWPMLVAALIAATLVHPAHAEALHYWRFEDGNFLSDSVGSTPLININGVQTGIPSGSAFPPFAGNSGVTLDFAARMTATPSDLPTGDFTIELLGNFTSLTGAFGAVLAGTALSQSNSTAGWLLQTRPLSGLTKQLVLTLLTGSGFAFIESGINLSTNTDYYIGASFSLAGTASFFVQNLTAGTDLQQISVSHSVAAYNDIGTFVIGATAEGSLGSAGLFDEVRLSDTLLNPGQLLVAAVPLPAAFILLMGPLGALALLKRTVASSKSEAGY